MKTQVSLDLEGKDGRETFYYWLEVLGWDKLETTESTWEVTKNATSTSDMKKQVLQDLENAFAKTKVVDSVKYDFLSVSGKIPD